MGLAAALVLPASAVAFTTTNAPLPLHALSATGAGSVPSTNWAGYAARGPWRAFRSVSARWVQPRAACGPLHTYAAFWVGLDGFGSGTVEQVGTSVDCSAGRPVYYGWYEMFPRLPQFLSVRVRPGDHIAASVVHTPRGRFVLFLRNLSTGGRSMMIQDLPSARLTSAEVIAEAPLTGSRRSVLPLANFRHVSFTHAVINGRRATTFHPARLTMVVNRAVVKARATAIAGGSFSVLWHHR